MTDLGLVDNQQAISEFTFRVGPLTNLYWLVHSLGCDPDPVFRKSGFEPEEFQDPDHRLPYLKSSHLLADCVEATGCQHLGLLLGQQAIPSYLGLAGFLVRVAPSVRQALLSLAENLDLHEDRVVLMLDIGPCYSSICYSVNLPGMSALDQINDLAVTVMYQIMRAICGESWTAARVMLGRREPEDTLPYRRFFKTAIHFNSTRNSITFPSTWLEQKPPAADELLYLHLQQEARELHVVQQNDIMKELPAALMKGLLIDKFSAQDIADEFGVHERTLHRRLRSAGTCFRQELDLARQLVSQRLLETTSMPVCEVAVALGYADSSGFIRAFQRWSGVSPSSWRKQNETHPGSRLVN